MFAKIQYRHGTAAEWTYKNPLLNVGEPGFESDTGKTKVGPGYWNDLPYRVTERGLPLVFVWDGTTYQPFDLMQTLSRQKWFTGPVDPMTLGASLALYDQWIPTSI